METIVYTRRHLANNPVDKYNSLSERYPPQFTEVEFWTNGHTTHLLMSTPTTTAASTKSSSKTTTTTTPSATSIPSTTRSAPPPGATKRLRIIPEKNSTHVARNSLIAGSLAGITSTLVCYPFDVLRTKMQSAALESPQQARPAGPLQVLRHTLHNGGVRALYTGLTMPLTAQAVYKGTVFMVNSVTSSCLLEWKTQERRKLGDFESPVRLTHADTFWCGMAGGAVNAALFVTPVEFIRNQLIVQHTLKARGVALERTLQGPLDVLRQNGLGGLWRGLGMTVARDSLGCGCFFLAMRYTQEQLSTPERPSSSLGVSVLSGAMAGLAYWVAALPLDTVKTWIQNGSAPNASEAIRDSLTRHGYMGTARQLCSGWQMAIGRGAPAAAITVVTYDWANRYLQTVP